MKKNNLAGALGSILLGVGSLFLQSKCVGATQDQLQVTNYLNVEGGKMLKLNHISGATETGSEVNDSTYGSIPPAPSGGYAPKIVTKPYGSELKTDSRPLDSETMYHAEISAIDPNSLGGNVSESDVRLYFSFFNPTINFSSPDSNRVYVAKIFVDGSYTSLGQPFNSVTNLADVVSNGGTLNLPAITNVPIGTVYGTVDVSCRFLTNAIPTSVSKNGTNVNLEAKVQPGTTNTPQYKADMTTGTWSNLDSFTQYAVVDSNNFNSTPFSYTDPNNSNTYNNASSMTFSNLPALGDKGFYRIKSSN
jgi:hypothetical protein